MRSAASRSRAPHGSVRFAQAIQERLNAMLDRIQQATDGGAESC